MFEGIDGKDKKFTHEYVDSLRPSGYVLVIILYFLVNDSDKERHLSLEDHILFYVLPNELLHEKSREEEAPFFEVRG